MSKRDRSLAQDFTAEERDFAAELGRYFDLENEELPPLYMQALTPPPGEEATPPDLVEHVRARTFAILRLPLPGHTTWRERLQRLRVLPIPMPRLALALGMLAIVLVAGVALLSLSSPPAYSDELPQVVTMEPADQSSGTSPTGSMVLYLDRPLSPNVAYALTISPTLAVRLFQQEQSLLIVPEQNSWGEADYRIHLLAVNGRGETREYHFSFAARKL
jgi:hypothetical protein